MIDCCKGENALQAKGAAEIIRRREKNMDAIRSTDQHTTPNLPPNGRNHFRTFWLIDVCVHVNVTAQARQDSCLLPV